MNELWAYTHILYNGSVKLVPKNADEVTSTDASVSHYSFSRLRGFVWGWCAKFGVGVQRDGACENDAEKNVSFVIEMVLNSHGIRRYVPKVLDITSGKSSGRPANFENTTVPKWKRTAAAVRTTRKYGKTSSNYSINWEGPSENTKEK